MSQDSTIYPQPDRSHARTQERRAHSPNLHPGGGWGAGQSLPVPMLDGHTYRTSPRRYFSIFLNLIRYKRDDPSSKIIFNRADDHYQLRGGNYGRSHLSKIFTLPKMNSESTTLFSPKPIFDPTLNRYVDDSSTTKDSIPLFKRESQSLGYLSDQNAHGAQRFPDIRYKKTAPSIDNRLEFATQKPQTRSFLTRWIRAGAQQQLTLPAISTNNP